MNHIEVVATDKLHPNDYNPNQMTDEEFAECVAEVRHLGRIPKPIIVRPNSDGYVIVDGEHGWRAAKEVGLTDVPCEVVDIDDFESMRQTYKRNQHGTHNPVKLGQMFQAMIDARGISNRALAKEIEVAEGTIRNALIYAKACSLRNDYAFESLSVKQIRYYVDMPDVGRDLWLDASADVDLFESERRSNDNPRLEFEYIYKMLSEGDAWGFVKRSKHSSGFHIEVKRVQRDC